MGESIISWNVPNFVTIGVMGMVMFTVFGMIAAWWSARNTGATG